MPRYQRPHKKSTKAAALCAMLSSGEQRMVALALQLVAEAFDACGGNATRAAAILGVSRETLYHLRDRYPEVARLWPVA